MEGQQNPLQHLQQAVSGLGARFSRDMGNLIQNFDRQLQPFRQHVDSWQRAQQQQQRARPQRKQHCLRSSWTVPLASMTMGMPVSSRGGDSSSDSSSISAQPVMDLAMARDEVKARLASIPVYTVANPKNEFVLVAGENNAQLGFFFLKREDAEALIEKIREENPRLARDSKVLRVTMDNVYEVFTTPREQTGLQGIHFRFFPDMGQVQHALQLYKDAGVATSQFIGVPVFQAEGLTVTTQELQYVPLFLHKEDLDVAVSSAYKQRNAQQIRSYRERAERQEAEYRALAAQAETAAAGSKERAALEARAGKARAKLDAAMEKAAAVEQAPLPKVEVGSFEEVISRMTASEGDEVAAWSQVMFVAPGLLHQAAAGSGSKPGGKH